VNKSDIERSSNDDLRRVIQRNWYDAVQSGKVKKLNRVGKHYGKEKIKGDHHFIFEDEERKLKITVDDSVSLVMAESNGKTVCDNREGAKFFIPGPWFNYVSILYSEIGKSAAPQYGDGGPERQSLIDKVTLN